MKRLVFAMLAIAITAGIAQATAREKRNAMHHVATAMAIEKLCPTLKSDSTHAAMIMVLYGIDLRGPDGALVKADAEQQIADMKGTPTADVCASGYLLYGPGGMNVPDLVQKR